jgi:hypothetical protein
VNLPARSQPQSISALDILRLSAVVLFSSKPSLKHFMKASLIEASPMQLMFAYISSHNHSLKFNKSSAVSLFTDLFLTALMKFLNAFNPGFLHHRKSSAVFSRTSGFDKSQNNFNASETLGMLVLAPPNTAGASVDLACGFCGWTSFVR